MEANFTTQLLYAFLGGLIPALIWLWFWLREDLHPEPKRLLIKAFAAGAIAIPFALLAEALLYCTSAYLFLFSEEARICGAATPPLRAFMEIADIFVLIAFAASEEVVKYISAKRFVLKGKDFDEPVDAMIYLITVALGFAAFENFFFLLSAFGNTLFEGIVVTNLRFLGATLLHAVSSGVVGYAVALSFFHAGERAYHAAFGLLAATGIHVLFNIFVTSANGEAGFGQALGILVLTSLFLIFAFDRVKKIKKAARFQRIVPIQNSAVLL
ncbi:MAG: PrsW family glutamic-type intramembrane protease [Patescibacteria group bacterium]